MSLAIAADLLATGGLDASTDYLLFRLPDRAALEEEATKCLTRASAYLKDRVSATYYTGSATANTDRDELFKGAEELIGLHFLVLRLKSRRVFGTHYAYDQEGSERFAELIDSEYLKQVEILIEPYVTIETEPPAPFLLPAFVITPGVDSTAVRSIEEQLDETILNSAGLVDGSVLGSVVP